VGVINPGKKTSIFWKKRAKREKVWSKKTNSKRGLRERHWEPGENVHSKNELAKLKLEKRAVGGG